MIRVIGVIKQYLDQLTGKVEVERITQSIQGLSSIVFQQQNLLRSSGSLDAELSVRIQNDLFVYLETLHQLKLELTTARATCFRRELFSKLVLVSFVIASLNYAFSKIESASRVDLLEGEKLPSEASVDLDESSSALSSM